MYRGWQTAGVLHSNYISNMNVHKNDIFQTFSKYISRQEKGAKRGFRAAKRRVQQATDSAGETCIISYKL